MRPYGVGPATSLSLEDLVKKLHRALLVSGVSATISLIGVHHAAAAPGDWQLNGEAGGGTMLSADQRDRLGFKTDVQASIRPGISLTETLALQLQVSNWWFPASSKPAGALGSGGKGHAVAFGLGLRFEPIVGPGRVIVDAHANIARTGGLQRFAFDAGLGYEFSVTPWLGIGPVLRYGQLRSLAEDGTDDAKFWSAALSVTLRACPKAPPKVVEVAAAPLPPPPPPKDGDNDGVPDAVDACPSDVPGAHPDQRAERRGCPTPDTDADGLTDDLDQCPAEAQGANPDPDKAGCPDGDDDKDGVLNHADKCPTVGVGLIADPARAGCPAPDKDKDSVPDAGDACPDKAGSPSADPKKNGCPGLVLIESGAIRINKPVFFAPGKDQILKQSDELLKVVGFTLANTPSIRKVLIEGHTDNTGKPEANLELSQRRAEMVKAHLVKQGIDTARLDAKGFGDTKPLEPNTSAKGRAANRRVQFTITDPASPSPAAAPAKP